MGLITEMSGAATTVMQNPAEKRMGAQENVIEVGASLFESSSDYQKYSGLGDMLEADDQKEQYTAALTLLMVERTRSYMEGARELYGDSTITANLGALPPRVLDVVRIFYPNQIANELLDIQPIDGEIGTIFTMTPRFTDSFGGVSAGDEIFQTQPTNQNYASEEFCEDNFGTGDGIVLTFAGTPAGALVPVRPGTVKIEVIDPTTNVIVDVAVDDGNGNLVGVNVDAGSTIDYATAATSITYLTAPASGTNVRLCYCYSSEVSCENIRAVEFDISEQPVKAKMHPITFKYTVSAGLAAKAHLAIDVQDNLAQLAAQYIKIERDNKVVQLINQNATPYASLNFNATPPGTYSKLSFYGEIKTKLDEARSLIQDAQGRGSVDWILVGRNAANVFSNVPSFRAAPVEAPIGPHVIGTLNEGTVTVVKVIDDNVLGPDEYIFGYKGYMAGDAAMILAEWIPIYFTPTFQNPRFKNEQGVMSMYDLFVNNKGYYAKGKLSGYVA